MTSLLLLGPLIVGLPASERPNVLLIMTDDQGFGDVASHGNPHISTPVHDRLAAGGARFERFFVSPVCAPTRASLLTGRYSLRTGVHGVTRGYETMRSEEYTLAEALRDAGYATGAFGKWHNGRHIPNHPNGQGFDEFVGFCGGHWNRYFDPNLEHNGLPTTTPGYVADVLTDAALRFIDEHAERPWFCYVPYNTPHSPWRVPEEYWKRYSGMGLDEKAQCAYAMVENIDWNLGRLLAKLDETELTDRTIVVFLSDNGANSDRFNAGMKGRKASVDEGGVRVPLFFRYPPLVPPRTHIRQIAAHIDLFPTILELCGVPLPNKLPLDGRSLVPLLVGRDVGWADRPIFAERFRSGQTVEQTRGSVRTTRWRAVYAPRAGWQLFDMRVDPGQERDVAQQHPQVVEQLARQYRQWFKSTGADKLGYHPLPIGHPARAQYQLPANEALLTPGHGPHIKYTGPTPSGFANCWITGWSSGDAYPRWQLDVLGGGRFGVELEYALQPHNVPARIAVEVGDQRLEKTLHQAHHVPLVPKADRFVPSTGYREKASWAWMKMGTIQLQPGVTDLVVRAAHVTGGASIELKSVRLTRLE